MGVSKRGVGVVAPPRIAGGSGRAHPIGFSFFALGLPSSSSSSSTTTTTSGGFALVSIPSCAAVGEGAGEGSRETPSKAVAASAASSCFFFFFSSSSSTPTTCPTSVGGLFPPVLARMQASVSYKGINTCSTVSEMPTHENGSSSSTPVSSSSSRHTSSSSSNSSSSSSPRRWPSASIRRVHSCGFRGEEEKKMAFSSACIFRWPRCPTRRRGGGGGGGASKDGAIQGIMVVVVVVVVIKVVVMVVRVVVSAVGSTSISPCAASGKACRSFRSRFRLIFSSPTTSFSRLDRFFFDFFRFVWCPSV